MLEKAQSNKSPQVAELEVEVMKLKAENQDFAKRLAVLENIDKLNANENEEIKESRAKTILEAKNELKAFEVELKRKANEERATLKRDLRDATKEQARMQEREEKAFAARRQNVTRIIANEHANLIAKLTKDKEDLEKKYNDMVAYEADRARRIKEAQEINAKRKREADEQRERERIAVMKVKAYEERASLEEEINELQEKISG